MASLTQTSQQTVAAVGSPEDPTDQLIAELENTHTKPLWAQMTKLNPPLPNPTCVPHKWAYDEIRPHLLKAGELITEKKAERRVLMLINPARGE
jgi:gentisate 1,2-dioxygenase